MTYEQKFQLVKNSLISHCKNCIRNNWEKMFDMWLICDGDFEFGHGYQDKFKEHFSPYMNSQINEILFLAGKNIGFAIRAFMSYKDDADLDDVIDFTEKFVLEQLDDFHNWCGDIGSAMYEETSECERLFGHTKEDNSS